MTGPKGPQSHTPDSCPRKKDQPANNRGVCFSKPRKSWNTSAYSSFESRGRDVCCVGETVESYRRVPDLRDLGGPRPLFNLFGLFSHLNQIKQLVTWSQSVLSTIASPGLPGILQFTLRWLRGGGLGVREPAFVSQL